MDMPKFKMSKNTDLEDEIARVHKILKELQPTDDAYATVADQLAKLYKFKETNSKDKLSKDTLVAGLFGVGQILVITQYEHAHALASKALTFVFKSR